MTLEKQSFENFFLSILFSSLLISNQGGGRSEKRRQSSSFLIYSFSFLFSIPWGCRAERTLRQQVILSPLRMMTRAVSKLMLVAPASHSVASTKKKKSPVNRLSTNLQSLVLLLLGNLHENQNNRHPSQQPKTLLGSSTAARALWGSLDCRQYGHSLLLS